MAEVKAVLDKYDIAGVAVLHTPGHTEYLMKIDPSYSCAKIQGQELRFKTKGLKLSKASKRKMIADTSNMMHGLSHTTGHLSLNLMSGSDKLDRIAGTSHNNLGHTSQTELDN